MMGGGQNKHGRILSKKTMKTLEISCNDAREVASDRILIE